MSAEADVGRATLSLADFKGPFVVSELRHHEQGFPRTWVVEVPGVLTLADCPREDVAHLIAKTLNEAPALALQAAGYRAALEAMIPGRLGSEYEYLTNAPYHACVEIARRALVAGSKAKP